MDRQYSALRLEMILIFLILCIVSVISWFVNPELSTELVLYLIILEILGFSIVVFWGNFKNNFICFALIYGVLYILLSATISIGLATLSVILPLIILGIYLIVPLYNKKLILFQVLMDIAVDAILHFYDNNLFTFENRGMKFFIFDIVVIIMAVWMACLSVNYAMKKERINREQQQSLDDLIKVVEAKCIDARAAVKSKSSFLANISHELRTPLNAILGMNLLIERETTDSKIKEYSSSIDENGKELLGKINNILDYSLLDSGNFKLAEDEYETLHMLNDINAMIKHLIINKEVEFKTKISNNVPTILYGDVTYVEKIIMSLVTNAIKYTDKGRITLNIGGERASESDYFDFIINVEDTGCGIKEENQEKIFESFNNEHDEKKYMQGTGIGLSMTKGLLKLMGGTISLTSEYGKGSSFKVVIPQKVISNEVLEPVDSTIEKIKEEQQDESQLFSGVKLLVVDDVSMNLKVFKGLLKKTAANVDTATGGRAAIELVKENKYDIIFLDHMMPDMDGVETLHEIVKLPDFSIDETPVIVLTANAISGAKEEYLSDGFVDYMTKPLKKDELFASIEKYALNDSISAKAVVKEEVKEKEITLEKLDFLDLEEGIKNCGNDESLFLDVVKEYYTAERTNEMELFYSKEDWKNYEILVHALKSTSKAIGAISFSDIAKNLEYAAKNGDYDYIKKNHDAAFNEYKEVLAKISKVTFGDNSEAGSIVNRAGKYLIYVVDDDSVNLKVAEGILKKHFAVEAFLSGQEVLTAMEKQQPNLLLLDIMMPNMSGFDVISKINSNPQWKNVSVIFITAEEDINAEIKGFKEGAMDFIRKPFSPQIMLERINRILELNQLKNYLESEVDRKTSKVAKLSLQAMETLAMTIDAKDKYTNGHSTRVAKYSRMIAERIGYSTEDLQTIYYMGLLHDIGKIGIADTIINKDGKLTDEEFAEIKKHPEIGYGILKNITEIPDIEKGARYHHERYDGRGYPDGLKGVEIPLFARIIAVADSYDAMTSKRSYRDVLPQDYVRNELIKGKGSQFDPALADIMVKMMDEDVNYTLKEH